MKSRPIGWGMCRLVRGQQTSIATSARIDGLAHSIWLHGLAILAALIAGGRFHLRNQMHRTNCKQCVGPNLAELEHRHTRNQQEDKRFVKATPKPDSTDCRVWSARCSNNARTDSRSAITNRVALPL